LRQILLLFLLVVIGACTFNIGTSDGDGKGTGLPLIGSPSDLSDFYEGSYTLALLEKTVEVRTETTEAGFPDPDAIESAEELAATIATDTVLAIAIDPESIEEDYFDPYDDNNLIFIGLFGEDTEDTADSDRFEFIDSSIDYRRLKVGYIEDAVGVLGGDTCNYHIVNGIEVLSDDDGPVEVKWQMNYVITGDGANCRRVIEIFYSASWRVDWRSDDPYDVLPDIYRSGAKVGDTGETGPTDDEQDNTGDELPIDNPYAPYYEYLPVESGLGIPI
jgi:hypothetical protein